MGQPAADLRVEKRALFEASLAERERHHQRGLPADLLQRSAVEPATAVDSATPAELGRVKGRLAEVAILEEAGVHQQAAAAVALPEAGAREVDAAGRQLLEPVVAPLVDLEAATVEVAGHDLARVAVLGAP